jgi:hypothetical protein
MIFIYAPTQLDTADTQGEDAMQLVSKSTLISYLDFTAYRNNCLVEQLLTSRCAGRSICRARCEKREVWCKMTEKAEAGRGIYTSR